MQELKEKVEGIISNTLPNNFYKSVVERQTFYNTPYLQIIIAAADAHINNVKGQRPQMVSFRLDSDLSLEVQHYGGCGGRTISTKPEQGSYLAIKSVKIPFRKPKKNEDAVLRALQRFCARYLGALKEHKDNLLYGELVDYNTLLNQ